MAVDSHDNGAGAIATLAEMWNGTSRKVSPTPAQPSSVGIGANVLAREPPASEPARRAAPAQASNRGNG
jgi:hypothetical protein